MSMRSFVRTVPLTLLAGLIILPFFAHADITSNLVGHWTFDEGSGTDAGDSSASNADGFVDGASWTTGLIGSGALLFDGINDVVEIANQTPFNFDYDDPFTLSAWIYLGADSGGPVLNKVVPQWTGYGYDAGSGGMGFSLNSFDVDENKAQVFYNQPATTTEWHHVVAISQGTGVASGLQMYRNGIEESSDFGEGDLGARSILTAQELLIGSNNNGSYFEGIMDDARVYSRALTQDDVRELFMAGMAGGDMSTGLIAHWTFDEGTGIDAFDSAGNHDGTLTNGPSWVAGHIGSNALEFDGGFKYVAFTAPALASESFTIAGWVYRDTGASGTYYWVGIGDVGSDDQSIHLTTNDSDEMRFGFYANDLVTPSGTFSEGAWHHVVNTYDVSLGTRAIYLDGIRVAYEGSDIAPFAGNTVGRIGGWAVTNDPWLGMIDDVRIYDRALAPEDVVALYQYDGTAEEEAPARTLILNAEIIRIVSGKVVILANGGGGGAGQQYEFDEDITTDLEAHWTLDEGSGTDAADSSGNGYDATLGNGPDWVTGKVGAYAIDFNADFQSVGTTYGELPGLISISAWIYPRTAGEADLGSFVEKSERYNFRICDGDSLCGSQANSLVYQALWSGTTGVWYTDPNTITMNAWNHVVVTYDNTSTATDPTLYINGSSVSVTQSATPTGSMGGIPYELNIGGNQSNNFDGYVDDIRIYHRILTAGQVGALYDLGN